MAASPIPQSGAGSAPPGSGLTTTRAPFIEQRRGRGEIFIHQPYELYSEENHETWLRLFERIEPRWKRFASRRFLDGLALLQLGRRRIPRLDAINRRLQRLTGFQAKPVSGYLPSFHFFDCLRRREFPTTVTIRGIAKLDYLPEPDIFHDVCGHVPMHTDPEFAAVLVRFGDCAHAAAFGGARAPDAAEHERRAANRLKALARVFWFTIEFGLIREQGGLRAYGSGLLSSFGELRHAIESPQVQRYALQLEWAVNQAFEIDRYQPLLFVIDSFGQLEEVTRQLFEWLQEGRLDNVAPGEPSIARDDLESFMRSAASR